MGGEDGDEEWLKDIADDLCYEDPEEEQGGAEQEIGVRVTSEFPPRKGSGAESSPHWVFVLPPDLPGACPP